MARVGPHQISADRLRQFVANLPDGLRLGVAGDAARRRYLQDLIDRQLLLMEAQARGLDTSATVRAVVEEAVDDRARNLYRSRQIDPGAQLSVEEVQRAFAEGGYDRERRLSAILVANREEIEEVVEKLAAGESFAQLARQHSLDEASAQRGGELGFVGPDMARRLQIPRDVFLGLPPGEVSAPLPSGRRWHVVKFAEDRPVSFEKYRAALESQLRRERAEQAAEEQFERLEQQFQVSVDRGGLAELVEAYRNRVPRVLLDSPTALYRYDEGTLSVGWAQTRLQKLNLTRGLADSAQALQTLRKIVLRPFLFEEAARRSGIYSEPELRDLVAQEEGDSQLEALRRAVITTEVSVTEEEARQYYDEHPELFHHEEAVWAEEVLLATESEARQARERIDNGVAFAELAQSSLRPDAVAQKAQYHYHPREKVLYPRLVPALLEAPPGQVRGPVEMEDGRFSVFRVLRREREGIEPFAVARRRAAGLLRRQREAAGLESLLAELRERHASQIAIDESRLRAALPDELLGD